MSSPQPIEFRVVFGPSPSDLSIRIPTSLLTPAHRQKIAELQRANPGKVWQHRLYYVYLPYTPAGLVLAQEIAETHGLQPVYNDEDVRMAASPGQRSGCMEFLGELSALPMEAGCMFPVNKNEVFGCIQPKESIGGRVAYRVFVFPDKEASA